MEIAALIVGFAFGIHLLFLWIRHMKKDNHYNQNIALHGGRVVGEAQTGADMSLLYVPGGDEQTVIRQAPVKAQVTSSFMQVQIRLCDIYGSTYYDCILKDQLLIGRYVPGSPAQIQIPDSKVSRNHCRIYRQGEKIYVQDLNSTNHTYLNGCMVEGAMPLMYGDLLRIGQNTYRFQCFV